MKRPARKKAPRADAPRGGGKMEKRRPLAGLLLLALLTATAACLCVIAVKLSNAPALPWRQLAPFGLFAASLPLVWVWLCATGFRGDAALVAAAFLLAGLGIVIQFRMGTYADGSWLSPVWLAYPLGLAAFLVCLTGAGKGRVRLLEWTGWPCYLAAVGLLAVMVAMGRRFRGGTFMAGNINPSEVVKPLLVIFLAAFLSRRKGAFDAGKAGVPTPSPAAGLGLLALWGVPMALTLLLRDLGLIALLNVCLIVMLFAVSRRAGYLALGLVGVVALGFLVYWLSPHARARFDVWLNPFADPTGRGWQVLQALSAMYSGGLWGAGIGSGVPHVVPIVTSDFIYAALAEEMGLAGCAGLILVYGVLFSRGWRAASAAAAPFGTLLAVGLTALLAFQTILNIGGVTKALPLTGITLPLISHGGSSLVTTLAMMGLLAAISDRK